MDHWLPRKAWLWGARLLLARVRQRREWQRRWLLVRWCPGLVRWRPGRRHKALRLAALLRLALAQLR